MRSLGCSPCTGAVRSTADTVPKIIENSSPPSVERQLRTIDHDQDGSMELKKREGVFLMKGLLRLCTAGSVVDGRARSSGGCCTTRERCTKTN